jgi:hypothetical protein
MMATGRSTASSNSNIIRIVVKEDGQPARVHQFQKGEVTIGRALELVSKSGRRRK